MPSMLVMEFDPTATRQRPSCRMT